MTGEVVTVDGRTVRHQRCGERGCAARTNGAAGACSSVDRRSPLFATRSRSTLSQPLELKGKAEPVQAYRLLRVRAAPERRREGLFVGRDRELALVREALERVRAEQRCELLTVIGEAGVGKSRLVAEALVSVEATVVRGRCLPYGEGITYWPVVEVLKQLDVLPAERTPRWRSVHCWVRQRPRRRRRKWPGPSARRWSTLRRSGRSWSCSMTFGGEETFRALIEHVALLSSGARVLLLCMARPELTERHPALPVTHRLEPLADRDVEELIAERVPERLRERIARAAGGNPLFIEEMLAIAREADGEVVVPPTLKALLAARLDQLESAERGVLERAAIEGEVFHRGAVHALSPDEIQVTPHLAALVRKGLIRPDKPQLAGEDGFRFRHLLICDAAYEALPKAERADLHERFAGWLERHAVGLVELDEVLGYHLEQAYRYRAELGTPDDGTLAGAAHRRLAASGHRAALRQDYFGAVSLLERATALVPSGEIDLSLETELGDALVWTGRPDEALRRADALADRSSAVGDRVPSSPGGSGETCPPEPRSVGRHRDAGRACRAGLARLRGRRRRPRLSSRQSARGGSLHARADGRSVGGRERASPMLDGRATCRVGLLMWRALSLLRHDPRVRIARLARRE